MKAPLTGGTPVTIAFNQYEGPSALAVGGGRVYWSIQSCNFGAPVLMTSTQGGRVTTLSSNEASPISMAADEHSVYWVDQGIGGAGRGGGGRIMKATAP